MAPIAEQVHAEGYAVVRRFIPSKLAADLHEHALQVAAAMRELAVEQGLPLDDEVVPGTPAMYGDSCMEGLLERAKPRVERLVARSLFPTYSYFRVYKRGDGLKAHTDRESCEFTVTLSLGYGGVRSWPLWIRGTSRAASVSLAPGDAMIYRGIDCEHWRKTLRGSHAAQVFLHYVDRHGPHRKLRFDTRPRLNTREKRLWPASLVRARLT